MNWSLDFAPIFPMPVIWAAGILSLILVALMFWRRTRGAGFRALAVATLFAALFNPTVKQEERETLANVALVIIDDSTSQALSTRPEQTKAIQAALEDRLGEIKNLDVKMITAGKATPGRPPGTNLFEALNKALANVQPDRIAGVIMVSDGQVHDVPKRAEALGFTAPVHALITGKPDEFDRRIEILKAPRYGIVGQSRDIEIRVTESGKKAETNAGRLVELVVRREGQPDATRQAAIGETVLIDMPFPHAGTNILEVELATATGELTPANNRVFVSAEGVRENLRVLLVSGEPHAGERTWRNLLKSDASVDLVHFTILRPPEKQDGTPINELSLIAFPTRELFSEKIKDFDLIIFDRYQNRGILQMLYYDNISRFVERHGGAVLVAAGDDYAGNFSLSRTPLASVLPALPTGRVMEEPFKAKMTDEGRKHPVTRDLAGAGPVGGAPNWGRWFRQVDVAQSRGLTLMNGAQDRPLLMLDRRGEGRVALLTSDQAWLWARGFEGGGPHTDLLRRLSHWLMKEPDLEEERLTASARGLMVTLERRSMAETVPPVTLKNPDGTATDIALEKTDTVAGIWSATVEVTLPGLYRAETPGPDRPLTAIVHAGVADAKEMSEVTATPDVLAPVAEMTGGGTFWTQTAKAVSATDIDLPRITMLSNAKVLAGSSWLGLRDRAAYVTKGVKLTPLFDGILALAALLALLSLAWWREGR